MTDPVASPPTVTDRRPSLRPVVAQRLKLAAFGVIVLGLLIAIATSGDTPAPATSTAGVGVPAPAPTQPGQIAAVAERYRALNPQRAADPDPLPPVEVAPDPRTYGYGGDGSAGSGTGSQDAAREARRQRDAESLFASNVVATRRAGEVLGLSAGGRQAAPDAGEGGVPTAPTIAAPGATGPGQGGVPTAAPPAPASVAGPAAAGPRVSPPPDAGTHRVFEGTILDAVLANRLEGSLTGPVNALVTTDVYAQDLARVIPAGARVLGSAARVDALGETRLAVTFHRVVLPNGRDLSLDQVPGMNQAGDIGLKDRVDNHYGALFGVSAAVGILTGLGQWVGSGGGRNGDRGTVVIAGSTGDAVTQMTSQTLGRFLNRLPSITIREGHRIAIYLTADVDLPEYGR